jgi:valyl-tRNA synthetase
VLLRGANATQLGWARRWQPAIGRLARASSLDSHEGEPPAGSAVAVLGETTVLLPLAGLIDLAAERARLGKERDKAAAEANKIAGKLANADFVARAPEEVVAENRSRLEAARSEEARLDAALRRIA